MALYLVAFTDTQDNAHCLHAKGSMYVYTICSMNRGTAVPTYVPST